MKYGLTENQLNSILHTCKQFAEIEEVLLFGSRAMNTYKPTSDIDLALKGNITLHTISNLQAQLEDLNIIFSFDVVNYHKVNNLAFLTHIDRYGTKIYIKGWIETTLEKVASKIIDYRGKTPKKLGGDWALNGNYRALSAKSVKTGGLVNLDQIKRVDHSLYKKWMKDEIQFNDILLTSEAPMGEVLLWNSEEKIVLSQRLFALRAKENISPNYLYYYFISKAFQHELNARASGTTVLGIRQTELVKTNVIIPPLEEQKAIANILTAFDDKIENLQAQNKTLERTAQTIFKEWFGIYQVGDELPDGWRVESLENLSEEITRGFTTNYVEKSNLINLNQKVNKGAYLDKQHFKFYSEDTVVPENKFVQKYDILLNSLGQGTLGRVHLYTEETDNVVADQHVSILRFDENLSFYIYQTLNSRYGQFRLENEITGSTGMLMLNIGKVREFVVIVPDEQSLINYTGSVKSLYKKLELNNSNIESLKKTRDTLLPKLMSGQLRVNDFKD